MSVEPMRTEAMPSAVWLTMISKRHNKCAALNALASASLADSDDRRAAPASNTYHGFASAQTNARRRTP